MKNVFEVVTAPIRTQTTALAAVVMVGAAAFGQVPGPSINMVSGTQWPGGDPFLQRQNEPSMAVSSRNNLHLLAGANDYRTVDLPGVPGSEPTGDAWLGLFKSIDGGQTWQSTLLPGYPQDSSPKGIASPLKGFSAAADPAVRAGTNGLFYYSGIVFNRATNASKVFVARFSDDNNFEGSDTMRYLDTSIVATGNGSGTFEDKPFIAVDVPRANLSQDDDEGGGPATCSIPATATTPAQSFPAGRVYMVWTEFTGPKANNHSGILFSRSTNCGTHWSEPQRISGGQFTNQGAAISIDPRNGAIYVTWRVFAHDKDVDAIYFAASFNGGQDFTKPIAVAAINPFDQGTTALSFRTNAFPSMAVDGNGRIYVTWAQRGAGPNGDSRVVITSLQPPVADSSGEVDDSVWNKIVWPAAVPVDPNTSRGHQFMPAMAFSSGKLSVAWYDLRFDDQIKVFTPAGAGQYSSALVAIGNIVFGTYIQDPAAPAPLGSARHTLDVRLAQAPPGYPVAFGPSIQVSQYAFGTPALSNVIQQLELNPPNLPMFQLGTVPFFGDYIDVAGPTFVPVASGGWRYNTLPTDPDNTRVVWTDNRNVVQPADGNWANYTPVGLPGSTSTFDSTQMRPGCLVGQAGMRNQDIFTAAVTPGVAVSAKSNSKPLSPTLQRAFPVTVQNASSVTRSFRLTIQQQPVGGKASFLQFPVAGLPDPLTSIDVQIPAISTAAKTVFATSTSPLASITVAVTEISSIGGSVAVNGLQSSVTLNQDVSNPNIANPNIANLEIYNPNVANPNIANPNIANPNIANPNIANPNIANPNIANVVVANPNIANPNIANPNIANPNIANPNIANPNIANPNIANTSLTDVSWAITNTGNTAASYSLKLLQSQAPPSGVVAQVIISKQYQNPVPNGCSLAVQNNYYPLGNVATPAPADPTQLTAPTATDPYSPTVAILPGETILVTVRAYDSTTANPSTALAHYNPSVSLTPVVVSHSANTGTTTPPVSLVILTLSIPPTEAGAVYPSTTLNATGGTGPYTWSISSGSAGGLTLNPATGALTGTPSASGVYTFVVTVTDQNHSTASRQLTLTVTAPPAIIAATAPTGEVGLAYSLQFAKTGGTAPFTWSTTGTLPAGVTLNPSSGLLSGLPQVAGTFNVNIQLTDGLGVSAQPLPVTLNINAAPAINAVTVPVGEVGVAYALQFTRTGGTASFTWNSSGTLPSGLTLNPTTGLLSGLPQVAGTFNVSIQLSDGLGVSAQPLPVTISINSAPAITSGAPPAGSVGSSYSYTLTASGGTGGYVYSLTGALPAGVSFTGTGLTGIPTATGSFPIAIAVMDTFGGSTSLNFTIVVSGYLSLPFTGSESNPAGTFQINPTPAPPTNFTYALDLRKNTDDKGQFYGNGVPDSNWTFRTTAPATGTATISYTYTGFHAYFQVIAYFRAFSGTNTPITIYQAGPADCCTSPSSGFTVNGSFTIPVVAGQPLGFVVGGSNFDSNSQLNGTLTINSITINNTSY